MKKRIVILGSTGSIGRSTLEIIKKNKKNFDIVLLTGFSNYKRLINQAKEFNAKNVIVYNKKFYLRVKKSLNKTKTNVYSSNIPIKNIISKKVDYAMSAIVGLAGLQPTINIMKLTKTLAIANKETIICGWEILSNLKKKYKTNILPVDSEHFSIYELTKNVSNNEIEEIIITASGGPFLNTSLNRLHNVKPHQAINHPNWNMGKKISIDSANLMNKFFEVIEAHKLFNFDKKKYKIMIHPQSLVHSIIRFKNGLVKMILYNTDMKIPISNTLVDKKNKIFNSSKINPKILNKLTFQEVDLKKFPSMKLINQCSHFSNSTCIMINAANEVLVNLFLSKKIDFLDIVGTINRIFKDKEFTKYAKRKANTIKAIKKIDNWARLKTMNLCVK